MAGLMKWPQRLLSVILSVVVILAGAANYGGVAAQPSGCATSLATLSPCMGYVTSNVSSTPPSQGCCNALSSVMQSSTAACLCQMFTANNPLGIPINQASALALPGACKITTPLTQCNVAGVPAASPYAVAGVPATSPYTVVEVPVSSPFTGPSAAPTTETAPSSSPATPKAVSPSSKSPSLLPPTTSVRGISPRASEKRTSKAGALFTPSIIISALAVVIVVSSIW